MTTITDGRYLEQMAPPALAEDWDNVGLLVGRPERVVQSVMTCLTITPASAREAVADGAGLIVAHHPLPFRPLKQITAATTAGRLMLDLIEAGIAVYSPHTAFDSACRGINQGLAELFGLHEIRPLVPSGETQADVGAGRWGTLPAADGVANLATRIKAALRLSHVGLVGDPQRTIQRVAIACGSGGQLLETACGCDCELFVTGETSFHTCLEAEARGVALMLLGHYASERFAVERLAQSLSSAFPALTVWASREEADPLRRV
jgi:dinuclear metal center YbgI/SA1388 family protein